ncbi:NAD(P)H-binding protein [Planotetraspora phitsanulokensis]|uniref:Nucleotide-diphosphate-sugar epimerase n=1 Tax=Planotetraspora phitsanulokensis TaxID=575192 RepID=A0A8J3XEB8_9ACTN|nr:NAD(P)H-binding protein [Planotetraspora phitsanulokensis]GII37940.1 nucleotide-diphosphate-sugar epimerase [Planotetraspora phitsanulokensis]
MILATGATGRIGRELVRELDERNAEFRILVRDPSRAADLPASAERVVGDLDEPATLTPAFDGIDRLFLLTPGIGVAQAANAVTAARTAGVRHIVLLSSIWVFGDPVPAMGRWHHEREQLLRMSGIPSTVLRPGGFTTNALEWVPSIHKEGFVLDAIGPGRSAPIDPADIAAVAALVLTEDGHAGQTYVLTGNETLTIAEQVEIIADTIGRDIEVRAAASPEEIVRSRYPAGAPKPLADAILEAAAIMRADTTGVRTDTVRRLLGRRPRTFTEWCARNADALRPLTAG